MTVSVAQYTVRRRLATYDVVLVFKVRDPGKRREVVEVLRDRMRRDGTLAMVSAGAQPNEVQVELQDEDVERAKPLLLRSGRLRMMLVVDEEQLPKKELDGLIAAVQKAKADGTHDSYNDPHDVLPNPRTGDPLLLERTEITGKDFQRFDIAYDERGRKALGFTMGPIGRKRLYDLTSKNVGRRLAIVFEGELRSAPEIRGPIGKKGIIEGGKDGWSDAELEKLMTILAGGGLPTRIELKQERDLGN